METLTVLMFIIISIIPIVYLYFKYRLSYWERRGVLNYKPKSPLEVQGFGAKHQSEWIQDLYEKYKKKSNVFGTYIGFQPIAVVTDLDIAKNILVKDFHSFPDRGIYVNERDDPLSAHLFNVEGTQWRNLRTKLTPTFTSGKMKFMFPTVVEISKRFREKLIEIVDGGKEIEMKDLLARFTTDIIGTCAFGIECNSIGDPNSEFRRMGMETFAPRTFFISILRSFAASFKKTAKFLHIRFINDRITNFFTGIVRETIKLRERENIKRNDFMNLLIELKNSNELDGLTIEEIAAQCFIFFMAGFETSSTTMAFCLYELAINQDVQEKLRVEIENVLQKYDGKLTYEAMMEMRYVEMVLNETLRKYPPVTNLFRRAIEDYTIPDTNITIEKNVIVWLPAYSFQNDSEIYPNPKQFNPERFTTENINRRHNCSFLSFGDGPRNCIGLRFGMMQSRIGLIQLVKTFRFSPGLKTDIPLVISTNSFILSPNGGLYLKLEKIQ